MNAKRMQVALADLEGPFPRDALLWARSHWAEAKPSLAAAAQRCATMTEPSEADASVAFFAVHLFADRRDGAIFRTLCALARRPGRLDDILGDVTAEHLNRLLLGMCEEDTASLRAVMEDAGRRDRIEGVAQLAHISVHV